LECKSMLDTMYGDAGDGIYVYCRVRLEDGYETDNQQGSGGIGKERKRRHCPDDSCKVVVCVLYRWWICGRHEETTVVRCNEIGQRRVMNARVSDLKRE
jgi:hypothetical protein